MGLNNEIEQRRAEIFSDGYSMSVGELISMYQSDELNIRPQFQRFFRWSLYQRSRLIESLLLKIPIPSIFVSQRKDGVWDVIDGQQRLSTIFQLVGVLKDEDGKRLDPLTMTKTKFLPSLADKTWDGTDGNGIGRDNQLLIKRSKIDVRIILRESSDASAYELYQRLNTGGSQLTDQEMRNVIMIMVDPSFYEWIEKLSKDDNFRSCTALSDRAYEERYDLELVMRFLSLRKETRLNVGDLGEFLDDQAECLAGDASFDSETEERVFANTFKVLLENYGEDIFRRYDRNRRRHLGGFLISAFEAFAIGLGWHMKDDVAVDKARLVKVVKDTWHDSRFLDNIGSGISASRRIPVVIPYARELLGQCLSVPRRS